MTKATVTLQTLETSVKKTFAALSENPKARARLDEQGATGGYFCVTTTDAPNAVPILVVPVGDIADKDIVEYAAHARRLTVRLQFESSKHLASESRLVGDDDSGNALRAFPYILSFWGIGSVLAGVLLVRTALSAGILEREDALERLKLLLVGLAKKDVELFGVEWV